MTNTDTDLMDPTDADLVDVEDVEDEPVTDSDDYDWDFDSNLHDDRYDNGIPPWSAWA